MKKALSFAVVLGLVAGMIVGCSTMSEKDQVMIGDIVEIAEVIDVIVTD